MLYGTNAWEINNSHSRGFFTSCCACGTNHRIEMRPVLTNEVQGEWTTRPYTMFTEIHCLECNQIVHVLADGTSKIVQKSDHITPTKAMEEKVGQTS